MKNKKHIIQLLVGSAVLFLSLALAKPVAAANHTMNFDHKISWTNGDCGVMSSESLVSERKALDAAGKKSKRLTVYSRQKLIVTGSDQESGKEIFRITADTVDGTTDQNSTAKHFSLKDVPKKYGKYQAVGEIPTKLATAINFKNESGMTFYHVQYRKVKSANTSTNGVVSTSVVKLQSQKAKSKVQKERRPFILFIIPAQNAGMIMLGFIGACVLIALSFAIRIIIDLKK
ncbi:MAG: hypothetical protein PUF82_08345 [Lactobacillus equicursoris]|uniref:hypothetical protein n=1 Tax=Lactobacillus equicursoris TaxID=420645 RepID=UPI00242A87CB|nr:hypothetical protein [Lactobacillus equicursoris]MDD6407983.1 hypothetical protein [Lactobacillus equicursoris]